MHEENFESFKIFNFLMINQNILFNAGSAFNRDTLLFLWRIVEGKEKDTFSLSQRQRKFLIQKFIESDLSFNEDTPRCILEDERCIELAIDRDIESIHYLVSVPSNLKEKIIRASEDSKFSVHLFTSEFVKGIFEVAFNSLNHDVFSADFLLWKEFSEEEINRLIQILIVEDYRLSENSPNFLKQNKMVVYHSIQQDLSCKKYMSVELFKDLDIFNYLMLNSYLSDERVLYSNLKMYSNFNVFREAFNSLDVYGSSVAINKYKEKFDTIFYDSIFHFPKISSFYPFFNSIAEQSWVKYKNDHPNNYQNIFAKICSYLRIHRNISGIFNLAFILDMESQLGKENYTELCSSMEQYANIYHSNQPNRLELLQEPQNVISKFSRLYVAKCKENYKMQIMKELYGFLKPYFTVNMENSLVKRRLEYKAKREEFKFIFEHYPKKISSFINRLQEKYSDCLHQEVIKDYLSNFVLSDISELREFESIPYQYSDYLRYKKALKLIHRLNSNYIRWDSPEMTNYKDLIEYNQNTKEYIYIGEKYSEEEMKQFRQYEEHEKVFNKIKKDTVIEIKKIELEEDEVDEEYLSILAQELPFKDEYFIFDSKFLEEVDMDDFLKIILNSGYGFHHESFLNEDAYRNLYQFLVNNGAVWLTILSEKRNNFALLKDNGFNRKQLVELISDMDRITTLANLFQIDVCNIEELMKLSKVINFIDQETISILGKDLIFELISDMEFTDEDPAKIIDIAKTLVCSMVTRNKLTVPYIHGELFNYKYSLYDSLDTDLLLAGIKTDACFRCDGNDNDFLHYCALDKNGFVIKIVDSFDNFVARASGFRHGNCVFINQLRTIYDETGNGCLSNYVSEKTEIIETFKRACQDIVRISQENKQEENPIDYVFANRAYCLSSYATPIPDYLARTIGSWPMDTESDDWKEFTDNVNLEDVTLGFDTDYGAYQIICMASSTGEFVNIESDSIHLMDIPAFYQRKRNPILVTSELTQEIIFKVNQIKAICTALAEREYQYTNIEPGSLLIMGDNWYIIIKDNHLVEGYVLEKDEFALEEFNIFDQAFISFEVEDLNQNVVEFILNQIKEEIPNLSLLDEGEKGGENPKQLVLSFSDFNKKIC